MDSDSDTAINDYENSRTDFYNFLIKTKSGKSAFVRFLLCTFLAFLTIVSALVPKLSYSVEFTLKAVFCFFAMIVSFNVYLKGLKALFKKRTTSELLVAVCTLVSYAYAIVTGLRRFESGMIKDNDFCFIIIVTVLSGILFGEFVKSGLENRSSSAVERLCEFIPQNVEVFRNGQSVNVEFKYICRGDCKKIMPGDKIPFDAIVKNGQTTVDESPLTGEGAAKKKETGDRVFAGSINKYGEITVESICSGEECLISRLIRMAKNELETKNTQRDITERVIGFYLPFVSIFALIVAVSAKFIGFSLYDAVSSGAVVFGLACPVAIAFAEPILTYVFVSRAYKSNILVQNPNAVLSLSKINSFVFNEKVILTEREYEISDVVVFDGFSEEKIIEYVASIETVSNHPISDAIFDYAYAKGIQSMKIQNFEISNSGYVKAVIEDNEVCFGNYSDFKNLTIDNKIYKKLKTEDKVITVITINSVAAAVIAAKASYKPDVENVMAYLKNLNIKAYIHSDYDKTSDSFPNEHSDKIKRLKDEGNFVAMVGDGINDTVSLILSDVGISFGSSAHAAIEASDIVIKNDSVSDVLKVIDFSKRCMKTAKQNIILSVVFNLILLMVSLFMEFYGMAELSKPVILTAVVSAFSVILNTIRVKNK